ncbi:MAG: PKD domain-containing protein, partial [Terriglobales bacterium]
MVLSMWNSGRNWLLLGTLAVAVCATPVASAADHDPAPAPAAAKTKAAKATAARRLSSAASAAGQMAPAATTDTSHQAYAQGSLFGSPGLFNTQFAETVAPGYATAGVYANRYTLEPGGQVVTDVQSGWTVGVTKWLNINFATTPYRRIRTGSPEQLSFLVNNNFTSFNNDNPFTRNSLITGPVDFTVGLTFGLLSQDRGAPFGLAIQPFVHIPYNQNYNQAVNQFGVGTSEFSYGENIMVDKWLGNAGALVFNGGWLHTNPVDAGRGSNYLFPRDEITWGYGVVFPRRANVQGIVELNGNIPFGAGTHSQYFGPNAPVWSTYGIRVSPVPWMGLNAGYRYADNAKVGNKHGFVFGLSFGTEPPPVVLAPPTPSLSCSADATTVAPGTMVHFTGTVAPTGYPYTYTWTSTGGKLEQSQNTATLDTTGLAPGVYSVSSHVDNGQGGFADCKTDVELREPVKNPPTVTASADPSSLLPGAASTLTAVCSSPDQRPLTLGRTVTAGKLDTNN